jgi:hypothetical protein
VPLAWASRRRAHPPRVSTSLSSAFAAVPLAARARRGVAAATMARSTTPSRVHDDGRRLPHAHTRGMVAKSSARTSEEWWPLRRPSRLRRPERVCFPHGGSSFYPHKSGGDYDRPERMNGSSALTREPTQINSSESPLLGLGLVFWFFDLHRKSLPSFLLLPRTRSVVLAVL